VNNNNLPLALQKGWWGELKDNVIVNRKNQIPPQIFLAWTCKDMPLKWSISCKVEDLVCSLSLLIRV
jgi:hypothetical protein